MHFSGKFTTARSTSNTPCMKKLRDGGMVTKHASGRDGHSFGNNYPVFTTHGRPVRNCRQAFGPSRKLRGACTLRGSDKYLPFSGAGTDNSVLALQHHAMPPPQRDRPAILTTLRHLPACLWTRSRQQNRNSRWANFYAAVDLMVLDWLPFQWSSSFGLYPSTGQIVSQWFQV